ncbi:MAG: hypothetical protein ABI411_15365 [Tahibacter sp.]
MPGLTSPLLRSASTGLAIALWWLLVLLWFAQVHVAAPVLPQQRMPFDGASFTSTVGKGEVQDGRLHIVGVGDGFDGLQVRGVEILDATRLTSLHYSFVDFPRTMELVFVFRRADQPDDVHTVPLASPRGRTGSVDLSGEAEWRGEIAEIGFAEYPAAQSVPAEEGFAPFTLSSVELWTDSWAGALSCAWHDWFAPRSWALLSISALGPDAAARHGRSLVLLIASGIGGTLVLLAVFGVRGSLRLRRQVILVIAVGWVALDLLWLQNLFGRHAATRVIYAGKSAEERQALVPDSALGRAALRVRDAIGAASAEGHIIVDASSDYERARLIYHLLPMNVAPGNLFPYVDMPRFEGSLLVLYALNTPEYDAESAQLVYPDGHRVDAQMVIEETPLRIYRLHQSAAP